MHRIQGAGALACGEIPLYFQAMENLPIERSQQSSMVLVGPVPVTECNPRYFLSPASYGKCL